MVTWGHVILGSSLLKFLKITWLSGYLLTHLVMLTGLVPLHLRVIQYHCALEYQNDKASSRTGRTGF